MDGERGSPGRTPSGMPTPAGLSRGMAICLTLSCAIAFLELFLGSAALNYHGSENYESLWFLLIGMPAFVIQILLSIALLAGLFEVRRKWAFAAQIPLAISTIMVIAVLGPHF